MDRMLRVNELLKRELGTVFERTVCTEFDALITITQVDTVPDLRHATVYVSVYGDEESKQQVIDRIRRKRGLIQREMTRAVTLKYTPRLEFRLDSKPGEADRVLQLIAQLEQKDDAPPAPE